MKQTDLKKLIDKIEPDQQSIAQRIIDELIFLQKILQNLRQAIDNSGVVGAATEIKSYNQALKNYGNLLKQLEMIIRKSEAKNQPVNAIEQFLTV